MSLKFIPSPKVSRFALAIGSSFFQTYRELGNAKGAYHQHSGFRWRTNGSTDDAFILEMVDGQWFVLYTIPAGTSKDSELPWYKEVSTYQWGTGWNKRSVARPMTREEYAEWRVQVDHELLAQKPLDEIVDMLDELAEDLAS